MRKKINFRFLAHVYRLIDEEEGSFYANFLYAGALYGEFQSEEDVVLCLNEVLMAPLENISIKEKFLSSVDKCFQFKIHDDPSRHFSMKIINCTHEFS